MSIHDVTACCICGAPKPPPGASLTGLGWDWWTGWLPRTEAACPACRRDRLPEVRARVELSRHKPPAAPAPPLYGYGIVDKDGQPWWSDACVCEDREPMDDTCRDLNDAEEGPLEDPRRPYRVVELR